MKVGLDEDDQFGLSKNYARRGTFYVDYDDEVLR